MKANKSCPICLTDYPTERDTCPTDGALLIASSEWAPGALIRNKYRILGRIGRGAMGTVYKAEHIALEEVRALKVMSPQLASDLEFVQRFQQEARAARRLQHRNIVRVDDLDQAEDGGLFIAMEHVDGVTLCQLLQAVDGPLPLGRAFRIVRGIAEGLEVAHSFGIVHRDIKPDNILMARGPEDTDLPKLADFGIAALKEHSTTFTSGSKFLLTPMYAAPEQWKRLPGRELDGRTDLYALGVTFYQMLTGRLPFDASGPEQWMYAHLNSEPVPPSRCNSALSQLAGTDALVLRLLCKNPADRFPDAQTFLSELIVLEGLVQGYEALASSDLPAASEADEPKAIFGKAPAAQAPPEQRRASVLSDVSLGPTTPSGTIPPIPSWRRRSVRIGIAAALIVVAIPVCAWLLRPLRTQTPSSSASNARRNEFANPDLRVAAQPGPDQSNDTQSSSQPYRAITTTASVSNLELNSRTLSSPKSAKQARERINSNPQDILNFTAGSNLGPQISSGIGGRSSDPTTGNVNAHLGLPGERLTPERVGTPSRSDVSSVGEQSTRRSEPAIPNPQPVPIESPSKNESIPPLNQLALVDQGPEAKHIFDEAEAKLSARNFEDAAMLFGRATRLKPNWSEPLVERAKINAKLGRFAEAIEDCTQALRLNPADPVALNFRGFARLSLNQVKDAIADLDEAIRIKPDYRDAYLNRGNAKWALKDKQGANADYHMANSLRNPNIRR